MAAVPMEHLVAAVRALDPGSRALLDLSLRRGVGDVEIARVLRTHPAEIALRRARVLDRLAGTVGVNGSGDLLETALNALPAEVWGAVAVARRERAPEPPPPTLSPVPSPSPNPPVPPEALPAPPPVPPPPFMPPPAGYSWGVPQEPEQRASRGLRRVAFGGVAVAVIAAAAGVAVGRRLRSR